MCALKPWFSITMLSVNFALMCLTEMFWTIFENQISALGALIKERGGSPELANMFTKLVEYYAHYQNRYVKHTDKLIEQEIEFVIEITSVFMKHVVRINPQ